MVQYFYISLSGIIANGNLNNGYKWLRDIVQRHYNRPLDVETVGSEIPVYSKFEME